MRLILRILSSKLKLIWSPLFELFKVQWRTEGISTEGVGGGGCLFQNLETKLNKKSRKNDILSRMEVR